MTPRVFDHCAQTLMKRMGGGGGGLIPPITDSSKKALIKYS